MEISEADVVQIIDWQFLSAISNFTDEFISVGSRHLSKEEMKDKLLTVTRSIDSLRRETLHQCYMLIDSNQFSSSTYAKKKQESETSLKSLLEKVLPSRTQESLST